MNRRGFLKVMFTGAVATAVPVVLTKALERRLPVIHGDGVHDDTEGLQAALEGRPFVSRDSCVRVCDGKVFIDGGNYRITTLKLHSETFGEIKNSWFRSVPGSVGPMVTYLL